ncbi:hypothetical protein HJC23_007414 [Cyclotella cryptica]|uniref:Plastid lipid-associated protein/fibrillin conserved domain-containing protein n=1 Tax=Cyclotella cryptica TaxID=29204 RepID=A0ABD3QK66_9STRA
MLTLGSSMFGSKAERDRVFNTMIAFAAVAVFNLFHVTAYCGPSTFLHHRHPLLHTAVQKPRILSMAGSGFGNSINKKPGSKPIPSKSTSYELFELQELRAQLETMTKQNILYQSLSPEKRQELTKYVKAVVDKTDSPIDVSGKKSSMGTVQFVAGIEGKSWRMVFSTDTREHGNDSGSAKNEGDVAELPYGSTVILRIGEFEGTQGTLDYVLKFGKQVMGLRELVAKSKCSVDVSV